MTMIWFCIFGILSKRRKNKKRVVERKMPTTESDLWFETEGGRVKRREKRLRHVERPVSSRSLSCFSLRRLFSGREREAQFKYVTI
jgi:hypothetical protein